MSDSPTVSNAYQEMSRGEIRKLLDSERERIGYSEAEESTKRWWDALESEYSKELHVVLRLCNELEKGNATITDYFLMHVSSTVGPFGELHMTTTDKSLTVYEIVDLDVILATHSMVQLDDEVVFPEPHPVSFYELRFFPDGISTDAESPSVTLMQFRDKRIAKVLVPDTTLDWPVACMLGDVGMVAKLHTRFRTFALYQSEDYATDVEVEIEVYNRGEFHANIFCKPGVTYRKLIGDYRLLAEIVKEASARPSTEQ